MEKENKEEPLSTKKVYTRLLIACIFIGVAVYFATSSSKEKSSTQTILSDRQIDGFIKAGIIKMDENMSNEEYLKMRKAYKADIKTHLNTLTIQEQNKVWSDYKEFYKYQLKIKENISKIKPFKFLDNELISYDYMLNIINTTQSSNFLTIYADYKVVRTYKARFEKPLKFFSIKKFNGFLKVYLPYFDTSIMIQEGDKEKIILINKMMEKSFVLLQKNKIAFGLM